MTLVEFLLARIAEDEAVAREALREWDDGEWRGPSVYDDGAREVAVGFDPRRVLAECEAKRRIVEEHCRDDIDPCLSADHMGHLSPAELCPTLRALAAVNADHPDYDDTWRP